jgi:hypothetical protein
MKMTAEQMHERFNAWLEKGSPEADALLAFPALRYRSMLAGGAVRDIAIYGAEARPRDLDIVVDCSAVELKELSPKNAQKTNMGGLKWTTDKGVKIDVWRLADTVNLAPSATFSGVPLAVTFNIDAVVIGLIDDEFYEHGFFDCIESNVLELNFEPAIYPALNTIRAAILMRNFNMTPGPKLRALIQDTRTSLNEDFVRERLKSRYEIAAPMTASELIASLAPL